MYVRTYIHAQRLCIEFTRGRKDKVENHVALPVSIFQPCYYSTDLHDVGTFRNETCVRVVPHVRTLART